MARSRLKPPSRRGRGGRRPTGNFGWWATIGAIVILGVLGIVLSRGETGEGSIVSELTAPEISGAETISVSEVLVEPYDRVESGDAILEVTGGDTTETVATDRDGFVVTMAGPGTEVAAGDPVATVQSGPDFNASNQVGHHWHTAYGVNVCGDWLPPLAQFESDLHTHGDGLIHVHARSNAAAGTNATVGEFFDRAGGKLDIDELEYPGDDTYLSGDVDCGGEEGVFRWALNGEEQRGDPSRMVVGNGDVIVLAFLPEDAELPTVPPSMNTLAENNYATPKHPDFEPPAAGGAPTGGSGEPAGGATTETTAASTTETTQQE